jgi:polyhydroxybutyrate depolymerase
VYLPSSYTAASKMPLVFVLHGFTQTANGIMSYSGFNAIAEANKFIAVYPNGTGVLPAWNANIGATGVNDIGFIHALLDTMLVNYSINPLRVYACGFSNGGFMSNMLACQSFKFKAIAGVGGTMTEPTFNACNPPIKIPVLQIHGTADGVVAYGGTIGTSASVDNTIAFWNNKNNCPNFPTTTALPDIVNEGSNVERIEHKPCDDNIEVQLIKVIGGGHQWPGAIGNSGIGNTNKDISASQEIWNFFNKFGIATNLHNDAKSKTVIIVHPNPAINSIQVKNSRPKFYLIKNIFGHTMQHGIYHNAINIEKLPQGLYILSLQNESAITYSITKFIKAI